MKKIKQIWISNPLLILLLITVVSGTVLIYSVWNNKPESVTVTIAIMQDDKVQDYNTNYYKSWLEKQSGHQIQFISVKPNYFREYIRALLTAEEGRIDAIFLPDEMELLTEEELESYAESGSFTNLLNYVNADSNLLKIFDTYKDSNMIEKMTEPDESIYFMPNMDTSRNARNFQVLWINVSWLKNLGFNVPDTTEDLHEVLKAFKEQDPNGNGKLDEMPLISCEEEYELQSYNYLLNAFIPNDPLRGRYYYNQSGEAVSALEQTVFREGLEYCRMLNQEGLLVNEGFSFTKSQVQELVNDPANLVGAFTSQSIADVVYANSPDVIARYIQVPPITGPHDERYAIMLELNPKPGGMIPANSIHKLEAFQIMDLMLSEEASLIAEFGEEGVDWKFSTGIDLSTYGTKAKITTIHYLEDKVQNQHFMGAGPQVIKDYYINGVTWNGVSSAVEYVDSRAVMGYEPYYLREYPRVEATLQPEAMNYIDEMLTMFIAGELDVINDQAWSSFQQELLRYGF